MDNELYAKVLNKAVRFLAYRPRTRKELTDRISRYLESEKNLSPQERQNIFNLVLEFIDRNSLVDDQKFAKLFIESKIKGRKPLGKKAILQKLIQKGVNKQEAFALLDLYVSNKDELKAALDILRRKFKKPLTDNQEQGAFLPIETEENQLIKHKMIRYLLSRGFSYEVATHAIDYLCKRP